MTQLNLYRAPPRKIRRYTERCLQRGVVPFIKGSPGIGKSSIVRQIAKDYNLKVIDQRVSTSSPVDFSGLPEFIEKDGRRIATFTQFDIFPTVDTPLPRDENGKEMEGWILFLDEFNSGTKLVLTASYKLLLDRLVGQERLHPRCLVVCAGNLATDHAIVNQIGTALRSRVVSLELELSHQEWLEDVAIKDNWDYRIIGFLNQYKQKLMEFKPQSDDPFSSPRTWEFIHKLYEGDVIDDEETTLIAGTITPTTATEFVQFSKNIANMVTVPEILRDPSGVRVPQTNDLKWATISAMLQHIDDQTFADLATYANRFDLGFRVLFFRSVMVKAPQLESHPMYARSAVEVARYLRGV